MPRLPEQQDFKTKQNETKRNETKGAQQMMIGLPLNTKCHQSSTEKTLANLGSIALNFVHQLRQELSPSSGEKEGWEKFLRRECQNKIMSSRLLV
ncbi:Uncharacterised protein [Chlamydia abortus]|nr:Uncharacterised protein [Chlamydia abortus]